MQLRVAASPSLGVSTDLRLDRDERPASAPFRRWQQPSSRLVIFATGRAPYTAGLGLEEAGVKLGRNGRDPRR
jgi:glutathione reductase (NADPH)